MINLGFSSRAFCEEYFEKKMLYVPFGVDPVNYDWKHFGNDFFSIEPSLSTVRFYRGGRIPREHFQQGVQQGDQISHRFDRAMVQDIIENGGSMVLNRFEKSSTYVAKICREISEFCGYATVGNAYATKGGTGTFGKHWDSHCVFAVQLIGMKRWSVFRPTFDLPIAGQLSKKWLMTSDSEIVFDGVLKAGDILYIPRGWWHEVNPIEGQPSLHIAVGIHTPKIFEYIKWILTNKMLAHPAFRETMRLGSIDAEEISAACRLLTADAIKEESFHEYLDAVQVVMAEKSYIDFDSIFQ